MEGFIPTGGKTLISSCSYCKRDTTNQCRIKCAECKDFQLCADCFAVGVELYPHSNVHSYRVVDSLEFPIFTRDWSANEELLLLEGIFYFNFSLLIELIFEKS